MLVYVVYNVCPRQDMHGHKKRTDTCECDETVFPRKRKETIWISVVCCPSVVVCDVIHLAQYASTEPYGLGRRRRIRLGYLQERAAPALANSTSLASVQPWSAVNWQHIRSTVEAVVSVAHVPCGAYKCGSTVVARWASGSRAIVRWDRIGLTRRWGRCRGARRSSWTRRRSRCRRSRSPMCDCASAWCDTVFLQYTLELGGRPVDVRQVGGRRVDVRPARRKRAYAECCRRSCCC